MAGATVAPLTRFKCGGTAMGVPQLLAGGLTLVPQVPYQTYMVHPDGEGDTAWQGGEFGFTASGSANITQVSVTVTHRVSSLPAFSSVTAQIYANSTPVGSPAAFTPSVTYVTETVTVTSGITAAHLPSLAVRVTFHQVAAGIAYVHGAYAEAAYSTADSVGIITVAGGSAVTAPAVTVQPPPVALVAAGTAASSGSPAFAQPTTAGDMLLAWALSNTSSATLNTTCSDPAWSLVAFAGAAFGWRTLWAKPRCAAGEKPPAFASPGATGIMSQLLEFSGARLLDQVSSAYNSATPAVSVTAPGPDAASGDLVVLVAIWGGVGATAGVASAAGADSSGAALPFQTLDNAGTTGSGRYLVGWAQASSGAGPYTDTASADLTVFGNSSAMIASFTAIPPPGPTAGAPYPYYSMRRY